MARVSMPVHPSIRRVAPTLGSNVGRVGLRGQGLGARSHANCRPLACFPFVLGVVHGGEPGMGGSVQPVSSKCRCRALLIARKVCHD